MALEDLTYGQDLLYYVLKFGGQSASTTDDYVDQAKAAIRKEYWEILTLEPWKFALSPTPAIITTVASQNVTVLSISGATVTLSATIAATVAGQKFYLRGTQAVYRILTHTAGTDTLVLDATYVETPASGAAVIYQDEYDLISTCMKIWNPLWLRGQFEGPVDLINEREFKAKYGFSQMGSAGPVEVATEIRPTSAGVKRVQLAPWSESRMNLEYDFTLFKNLDFTGAGAGDTPALDLQDRWIIAERALYTLWRNKNDTLAAGAWDRAEEKLNTMKDTLIASTTRSRGWVQPRFSLGVG